MAKATKRRSPAKRKPAARTSPTALALSGWFVAAGLGAAMVLPQTGLLHNDVYEKIPSIDRLKEMASFSPSSPSPSPSRQAEPVSRFDEPTAVRRPVAPAPERRQETVAKKPVLAPIKAETIAEIVRKAEVKPAAALPKPQSRVAPAGNDSVLMPPAPVPLPVPVVTATVQKDPAQARLPTAKPGDLAIRRYPFTTAPAVAYVGDLRTIRILGGEGDWKRVEISSTGVTGWLRLQKLG